MPAISITALMVTRCSIQGKYIKYPKNSNCQRWMKRETSRKSRNCQDLPRKGNYYRRLFDYWWTLY